MKKKEAYAAATSSGMVYQPRHNHITNYCPGWTANILWADKVSNHQLKPVCVDGWQCSSSTGLFLGHTLENAPTKQNPIDVKEYTSSVTSYIFPNQKAWMNGGVIAEPKKSYISVQWQGSIQHCQSKTENWYQGGKKGASADTRERNHQQEKQRNMAGNSQYLKLPKPALPIMCVGTLTDVLNTFYAPFDLLNNASAVKSMPPPEDQPLSLFTGNVKKK